MIENYACLPFYERLRIDINGLSPYLDPLKGADEVFMPSKYSQNSSNLKSTQSPS